MTNPNFRFFFSFVVRIAVAGGPFSPNSPAKSYWMVAWTVASVVYESVLMTFPFDSTFKGNTDNKVDFLFQQLQAEMKSFRIQFYNPVAALEFTLSPNQWGVNVLPINNMLLLF